MKKIIIIIFLLSSLPLFSQSITWQRLYDGQNSYDDGREICESTDGNFIVAGFANPGTGVGYVPLVFKINPYGDTLWVRLIPLSIVTSAGYYCVAPTGDGGCVIAGDSQSNFVIRVNSNGTTRWIKYYSPSGQSMRNFDIKGTSDGGFIFCGRGGSGKGYISKIDSSGNLKWQNVDSSAFSIHLRTILYAEDGGFVIVGTSRASMIDTNKVLILKIDKDGKTIFEKKNPIFNSGASALVADKLENGYLIGGTTAERKDPSLQGSSFFVRVDSKGNIQYSKIFYTDVNEYFYDIKKINENRYIFSVRRVDTVHNARVYIVDSLGNIIRTKIFYHNLYNTIRSVLPLENGDIMLAGIYEFGELFLETDAYVIRTDSLLNFPPLSISTINNSIPEKFNLYQNYPNPFNPVTMIRFDVKSYDPVSIKIYDILGKEIVILVNEKLSPGSYEITFDASNLSSGIYFYRMEVNEKYFQTRKMVLIR